MSKPKRKRKSSSESVAEILARWRTPLLPRPAPEEPEEPKKKRRGGGT
jgi:hypothetical protein